MHATSLYRIAPFDSLNRRPLAVGCLAALLIVGLPTPDAHAGEDEFMNQLVRPYSSQRIVCLDVGESYRFQPHDGTTRTLRLVSAEDKRDTVIGLVRQATVRVTVDGQPLELSCMPYTMPTEIGHLRLQADLTSGWFDELPGRAQFSIWDARDPIVDTNRFCFPIRQYRMFSHALQAYNEVVHAGKADGDPQGGRFYHGYGFDLAGYEGRETVVACTDGRIVQLWPNADDASSVVIEGVGGVVWEAAHLESAASGLRLGQTVRQGQPVGILGKRGASGNFAHLHMGVFPSKAHLEAHTRTQRLNLYPWLVTAYLQQTPQRMFAIARPHHTIRTGESVQFDAGRSIALDSKIVSYRWEFHDGEAVEGIRATKQFGQRGVYIATLRIKDDRGKESIDFCKIKVFSRTAPEATMPSIFMTHTPTQGGTAPCTVTIRCWTQSDADAPMQLDFGDGYYRSVYDSYAEVTHQFDTPGNHIVTATATINGLPVMQRQCINIEE